MSDRLDRWADPPLLVLASLSGGPKHGYAIMQDVAETMGVRLTAGTLYAVIARLEARGLIEATQAEDRRRPYRLTGAGAGVLTAEAERMQRVASIARERLRAAQPGTAAAREPASRQPAPRESAPPRQPAPRRAARHIPGWTAA